jgi:putative DNA primase/helicase
MNGDNEQSALTTLRDAGLVVDSIAWDGSLHRCGTQNKPGGMDGCYIAHADSPITLWWKNWQTGRTGAWSPKEEKTLTPAERAVLKARIEADRQARGEEQAHRHAAAAEKAEKLYAAAVECVGHPYLERKGVRPVPVLKVLADGQSEHSRGIVYGPGSLVVPLRNEAGQVVSLQFINDDGKKAFLSGGRKRGCYFPIGGKSADKPLLICEGLATGLSLHECLAFPVLVAFDAGNLRHVAELARRRYPDRQLVVCADYDDPTDQVPQAGGVGVKAATDAAIAVNGIIAVPRLSGHKVDWNDLHQKMGAAEVSLQFQTAHKPESIDMPKTPTTETTDEPTRLNCVSVHTFLGMDFPEREMLLTPVLPRQGLVMIHASRGVGKTFVALSIAYAVASGGQVFGRWSAPKPARVLFLDGEMPGRTMQERLAAIVAGSDVEPPDNTFLRIVSPDMQEGAMPNLATASGQDAVAPLLDGVDLVVVDNLSTLARHGRANDEESWVPVQGWLLELRRRGISALLVHHQGKAGDQRGTSAREDILDTVVSFRRPKDYQSEQGARFEVHLTKARGIVGADAQSFEAQLFTEGSALSWVTRTLEDAKLAQLRRLLADGYTIRDAADEMEISKSAADRLKQKLKADMPSISQGTKPSSLGVSCEQ